MKKKLVMMLLSGLMVLQLMGCGGSGTTASTQENTTVAETETATEEGTQEETAAEDTAEAAPKIYFEDIAVDDFVTLGEYKGLEVIQSKSEITDAQVEDFINYTLSGSASLEEITDRDVVEEGDIANIDYEGKKDGVAFDGGTAQGYDLGIGSGSFIPGFEEGLVGVKVGETVDIDLTFPENYRAADLAGQAVVFTVTVNSISKEVTPELNDEYVQGLGIQGVGTVEQFREYAREGLEAEAEQSYTYNVQMQLMTLVAQNATIQEPPADLIAKYKNLSMSQTEYQAAMYGMDLETFVSGYYGVDLATYETQIDTSALETAKQALVCYKIAKEEGLEVTEEELNSKIEESYASMGYASADAFKETVDLKEFSDSLLLDKVLTFLVDNANITDSVETIQ